MATIDLHHSSEFLKCYRAIGNFQLSLYRSPIVQPTPINSLINQSHSLGEL